MIEIFMLYLSIPSRINFLQLGRYSRFGEQRFRRGFELGFDFFSFTEQNPPLLYNSNVDPSEKFNVAEKRPEIFEEMKKIIEAHKATIVPVENQLEKY